MTLDAIAYRRAETMAYSVLPTWREYQMWRPKVFETAGFPIQAESLMDLRPLLDTMQEMRFPTYQKEMAGLTKDEVSALVDALRSWCKFAVRNFFMRGGNMPLDTMMSQLCVAWRLDRFAPKSLLEIGPGCGYLAFFLDNSASYHQAEITESFYLLQGMVNTHCFGDYSEMAVERKPSASCVHWPWWRIREIAAYKFDAVTANACFSEMTLEALDLYARLIHHVLTPGGVLVVQCYGGNADENAICSRLEAAGLCRLPRNDRTDVICVSNDVWARKGETPVMQEDTEEERRIYTSDEIIELLTASGLNTAKAA